MGSGRRLPRSDDRKTFLLRMPADLHRQLKKFSIDEEISLNAAIVAALEEWWKAHPASKEIARQEKRRAKRAGE